MSHPESGPFTPEDAADLESMSEAEQQDPEGFDSYMEIIDEANAEAAEAGEGEV